MAIISVTPVLGFSPTLQSEDYPYFGAGRGATPQLGSQVTTVDTDTGADAIYEMDDVGAGVHGWVTPPPA